MKFRLAKNLLTLAVAGLLLTVSSPEVMAAGPCKSRLSVLSSLQSIIDETAQMLIDYQNTASHDASNAMMRTAVENKLLEFEKFIRSMGLSETLQNKILAELKRKSSVEVKTQDFKSLESEKLARENEGEALFKFEEIPAEVLKDMNFKQADKTTEADWSHDGQFMAVGSEGQVTIYETGTWKYRGFVNVPDATGHNPTINLIKFSPDGKYIFIVTDYRVYRFGVDEIVKSSGMFPASFYTHIIAQVSKSDESQQVPRSNMFRTASIDFAQNKIFCGNEAGIMSFKTDGPYLDDGTLPTTELKHPLYTGKAVSKINISPDGKYLWRNQNARSPIKLFKLNINGDYEDFIESYDSKYLGFSRDSQIMARGLSDIDLHSQRAPPGIELINLNTLKTFGQLQMPEDMKGPFDITHISFSDDGESVVAAYTPPSWNKTSHLIVVWDVNEPMPRQIIKIIPRNNERIKSVSFSRDGRYILATGTLIMARIWKRTSMGAIQQ